jgi:hypothetical protein
VSNFAYAVPSDDNFDPLNRDSKGRKHALFLSVSTRSKTIKTFMGYGQFDGPQGSFEV